MRIISHPTTIVSADNGADLESMINDYCGTLGSNCTVKKESALTASDFSKNLFVIGVLSDFKKWKNFKSPVTIDEKGFIINNRKFQDKSDGFAYVDTNKIFIGGNSLDAVKDAQLALTGGHDILITEHGKITFFGNKRGGKFDWFNLQNLKSTNYTRKFSDLFSNIYISKSFKEFINYPNLEKELRSYVQQFLSIYEIKKPDKKIAWFIHSTMQEYGTMSGMFGLTCPGNNSAGFSIRGEIHTKGFNTGLVKHEYSHYLFDNTIPQENNRAFFIEGCVEYVTNMNDSSLYRHRVELAKMYRDTLNYTDLIINNKDFYGQYSDANYSVCGVFVKYIIDNFGVASFKKYCLAKNKTIATKEIFKDDFEEFISGYKNWLAMQ